MNIEQISQSWRKIAPLLVPVFSEEDCDHREEELKIRPHPPAPSPKVGEGEQEPFLVFSCPPLPFWERG